MDSLLISHSTFSSEGSPSGHARDIKSGHHSSTKNKNKEQIPEDITIRVNMERVFEVTVYLSIQIAPARS